jgi:glutamate decarboxylase
VFELSARLREKGWIVPAYTLPPNANKVEVMRVVVKENFSRDMAEMLVDDIRNAGERILGAKHLTLPAKEANGQRGGC